MREDVGHGGGNGLIQPCPGFAVASLAPVEVHQHLGDELPRALFSRQFRPDGRNASAQTRQALYGVQEDLDVLMRSEAAACRHLGELAEPLEVAVRFADGEKILLDLT